MRIIKSCFSIFFLILIILVLTITLTLNSLTSVIFSTKVPHAFINSLDFKELASKGVNQLNNEIKENPDEPSAGGEQKNEDAEVEDQADMDDIQQGAEEIISSITAEEEKTIKSELNNAITEFFDFLTKSDKKEIKIHVKEVKRILFKLTLRSDEFTKNMQLPKPICEASVNGTNTSPAATSSNCILEEDIANIIDKSLTGTLVREDIEKVIPICSANQSKSSKDCLPEEEVNELLKNSKKRAAEKRDPTKIDIFSGDDVIITEEQIPNELMTAKSIISRANLLLPIAVLVCTILALFIFILKRRASINYLITGLIIATLLVTVPFVILKTQTDFFLEKIGEAPKLQDNVFIDEVNDVIQRYSNAFANAFLLRAIVLFVVCAALITLAYFLKVRKQKMVQKPSTV
ncbi:MAG: hypothetical protein US52_C0001G0009 [candidate division WS6 bacterium GW2011_GWA2_37_6]|uniref:Uncharacterized protein n=1 Tax=candidate division WS6 bacterium GW2011_GWA2_37_6 TaxID=1619087 RepID=A0A0G0K6S9_9BACT|nr:MAG: hypothetical protein US52_C0001G0009 [candidate division WS6 bacterium GW2011_GWA2_37_6]